MLIRDLTHDDATRLVQRLADAEVARMTKLLERRSRLNPETGCREWTGYLNDRGYGMTKLIEPDGKRRTRLSHRVAWMLVNGIVPDGRYVCHRCDNPACINPDHLWLGNAAENTKDSVDKNRHHHGEKHNWARLTEAEVTAIRAAYAAGTRQADLARQFNRPTSTIEHVVYRRSWRHLP